MLRIDSREQGIEGLGDLFGVRGLRIVFPPATPHAGEAAPLPCRAGLKVYGAMAISGNYLTDLTGQAVGSMRLPKPQEPAIGVLSLASFCRETSKPLIRHRIARSLRSKFW